MSDLLALVNHLADDAASCPEPNCGDHDLPIEDAVALAALLRAAQPAPLDDSEWGSDLDVADWLVWYARKAKGKSRDVAQRALEQNPSLRFSERVEAWHDHSKCEPVERLGYASLHAAQPAPDGLRSAIDRLSVWAVRYALGRMTYAVSDVVDSLITYRDALTDKSRAAILRDIDKAIESGAVGMAMDALEWGRLRDALAAEAGG